MFRLLALSAMVGVGIGAYKFFKKKKDTKNENCSEQNSQNCEENSLNQQPAMA